MKLEINEIQQEEAPRFRWTWRGSWHWGTCPGALAAGANKNNGWWSGRTEDNWVTGTRRTPWPWPARGRTRSPAPAARTKRNRQLKSGGAGNRATAAGARTGQALGDAGANLVGRPSGSSWRRRWTPGWCWRPGRVRQGPGRCPAGSCCPSGPGADPTAQRAS